MNCRSVRNRLSAYLDRELGGDELLQMRAHISSCSDCRIEVDNLRALKALLGGVQCPEPPADLADRLTAKILQQRVEEPKRTFRVSALMFAGVTACSMLATLAFYGIARNSMNGGSTNRSQDSAIVTIDDGFTGTGAPIISAANFGPR